MTLKWSLTITLLATLGPTELCYLQQQPKQQQQQCVCMGFDPLEYQLLPQYHVVTQPCEGARTTSASIVHARKGQVRRAANTAQPSSVLASSTLDNAALQHAFQLLSVCHPDHGGCCCYTQTIVNLLMTHSEPQPGATLTTLLRPIMHLNEGNQPLKLIINNKLTGIFPTMQKIK